MTYYITCPDCRANLDPGEKCDCISEPSSQPTYLTVKDVSERWNVSVDLVYSILRSGDLRGVRIGGKALRIPVNCLKEYEEKLLDESTPLYAQKKHFKKNRTLVTRV